MQLTLRAFAGDNDAVQLLGRPPAGTQFQGRLQPLQRELILEHFERGVGESQQHLRLLPVELVEQDCEVPIRGADVLLLDQAGLGRGPVGDTPLDVAPDL